MSWRFHAAASAGLLCAAACVESDGDGAPFVQRDSAGLVIAESTAPAWSGEEAWTVEPQPTVEIGEVEGDPEYMFERVRSVDLVDERLVVADEGATVIRVYDLEGSFIGEMGGRGQGPGEFTDLATVWQSGERSIAAQDFALQRVTEFELDGDVVRTARISQEAGRPDVLQGVFGDGSYVFSRMINFDPASRPEVSRDSMRLAAYGVDGRHLRELADMSGMRRYNGEGGRGVDPFSPWGFATVRGDLLYLADSSVPQVRVVNRQGRSVRIVRWERPPGLSREEALVALRDHVRREENAEGGLRRLDAEPTEGSMPTLSNLLVDVDGFLWVREYEALPDAFFLARYGTRPGGSWRVFDPSGRWLGTVSIPADLIPSSIESDLIVGTRRDQLGVQYVRVHRLRRG